jgi:hypothetical protein
MGEKTKYRYDPRNQAGQGPRRYSSPQGLKKIIHSTKTMNASGKFRVLKYEINEFPKDYWQYLNFFQ